MTGREQAVDAYVTERINAAEGEATVEQIRAWEQEAQRRSRTLTEYAIFNGNLVVSGPGDDALLGLWDRLSTHKGLRLVQRTVTYGEWTAACCAHAVSEHDQHGCTVDVSENRRAYIRCHTSDDAREQS